ncbi:DNA-binding response regulator [Azoarcus olearius]|uniref:response regulator n=1 Tax=Azoarcus sp. (strain BH72) TaxID=418699 RepID=UPI000806095C|nr:response regulator [Azoarcus olearius]ANQ86775.1 DNA-binding response regulator [Azoarcus olearius]
MSHQILIVDDDPQIRSLLADYLDNFGFACRAVGDATAMRAALAARPADLVILDLMLPGEDGLSLCRTLRTHGDIPIIMLTARAEAADRIVGLELGADDYVVKPFDPRELVARIHTILRRAAAARQAPAAEANGAGEIAFAGWQLNPLTRVLTSPERLAIPLSNAEFRLLWVFIERPRCVLNRDQLLDAARGRAAEAFDRSIDLLVSRLRQKLQEDPRLPKLLKTIRGEGYLFDTEVVR